MDEATKPAKAEGEKPDLPPMQNREDWVATSGRPLVAKRILKVDEPKDSSHTRIAADLDGEQRRGIECLEA